MNKIEITKDADALICLMYKKYCENRKAGKSIEESVCMGDDTDIVETLTPKWLLDDITHLCWYLHGKGLLFCMEGSDHANNVCITDDGIRYMQDRFPNGISQLIDAISKIAGFVTPWL